MKKKRKLKKKVKLVFILLLILIIGLIMVLIFKPTVKNNSNKLKTKKTTIKKDTFIEECKKLNYCYDKNISRYKKYKTNNNLQTKDIVTRVNLGLDYKFYTHTKKTPYLNKYYILVNKYYYLDSTYIPNNLETIPEEYARSGMKLVKDAKDSFVKMARAAAKNKTPVIAMSSYRSYDYQVDLYNKYKESDGEEAADTYSARPGFSEHQSGLCVDVYDGEIDYTNFEKSESFKWMQDNSYKYGFILRFPKNKENITGYQYESWHYRYVGVEIAKKIHDTNITFDEYYIQNIENNIKQ